MRILKVGISIKNASGRGTSIGLRARIDLNNTNGFTFLELLLVIAVLSAITLIVFPKLSLREDFLLKSESRRLAGVLRHVDELASVKKIYYRVWFYPEEESFKVESSRDGIEFTEERDTSLKGGVLRGAINIQDIVIQGLGRIDRGRAALVFNPMSGAEPFNIHLDKNGQSFTLNYNPYSGRVKILEGYV